MNSAMGRPRGSQVIRREQHREDRDREEDEVEERGQAVPDVDAAEDLLAGRGQGPERAERPATTTRPMIASVPMMPTAEIRLSRCGQIMSTITTRIASAGTASHGPMASHSFVVTSASRGNGTGLGDLVQHLVDRLVHEVEDEAREEAEEQRQRNERRERQQLDPIDVREVVAEALEEVADSPNTTRWYIHMR